MWIRPIIAYGSTAFCNIREAQWKQLEAIQNKTIRLAYKLPYRTSAAICREIAGIESIKSFILKLSLSYLNRARNNPTIKELNRNYNNRAAGIKSIVTTPLDVLNNHITGVPAAAPQRANARPLNT